MTSSVITSGLIVVFLIVVFLILLVYAITRVIRVPEPNASMHNENVSNNNSTGNLTGNLHTISTQVDNADAHYNSFPIENVEGEDLINDEVIAAISAAVAVMLSSDSDKAYTIKSIRQRKTARPIWSTAGIFENTKPF